ncbi:MAG: M28 family peptidase [Bacteroidota bacterium]|nr:M28 family peptidase [Bacteroidota bacterium]
MNKRLIIFISLLSLPLPAFAQDEVYDEAALTRMKADLTFLSSDSLKGRLPGTPESDVARDYIQSRMAEFGLLPFGEEGYLQPFPVAENVKVNYDITGLRMGKKVLIPRVDFYPVAYSSNGQVSSKTVYIGYGITKEDGSYNDYGGKDVGEKIAVLNISSPDGIHPHSAYKSYHSLNQRLKKAKEKGALAVLLINPEKTASDVSELFKSILSVDIPVLFVRNQNIEEQLVAKSRKIRLSVNMEEQTRLAYNVIGLVDNGQRKTVVLGAHYDHIGMGAENSLYKGKPAIHNGADDNGSGTTLLLELLSHYGARKDQNYNYAILFFSAEENGLIGSKYFVEHPTFPLTTVDYMINFDMVGRLRDNRFQISGTGTAREWDSVLFEPPHPLNIKKEASGVGPSDHTSFYNKGIPVLHFFTGTHGDYHKPSDDLDKVNFKGMLLLSDFVKSITLKTAKYDRLTFQKTKSAEQKTVPGFTVTLGIMPDYIFGGPGVKLDGVTENRPAAKAGMIVGDIVIRIGDFIIDDIYSYMRALSAFKLGDITNIVYQRGDKELESKIQF